MTTRMEKVHEFNVKHNAPLGYGTTAETRAILARIANDLGRAARELEAEFRRHSASAVSLRGAVICEEVSELCEAMSQIPEGLSPHKALKVEILDALADTEYVTTGTAVTFGLPLAKAFSMVHTANMKKAVTNDRRVRDKGDDWQPPALETLLKDEDEPWWFQPMELAGRVIGAFEADDLDIEELAAVIEQHEPEARQWVARWLEAPELAHPFWLKEEIERQRAVVAEAAAESGSTPQ